MLRLPAHTRERVVTDPWTLLGVTAVLSTVSTYLFATWVLVPAIAAGSVPVFSTVARSLGLTRDSFTTILEHGAFGLAWLTALGVLLGARTLDRRVRETPESEYWPRAIALFTAVTLAVLLLNAAHGPVNLRGDGNEYFLTMTSFENHLTPDLRGQDIATYSGDRIAADLIAPNPYDGYFRSEVDGRYYPWHFWLVPALAAPISASLRMAGASPLLAFELLNNALIGVAMLSIAFMARLSPRQRAMFAALVLFSPLVWYSSWPSAEVFSAVAVIISICAFTAKRSNLAVFMSAMAATQNPSLLLLVIALGAHSLLNEDRTHLIRRALLLGALGSVALLPMAFYMALYGTPNLIQGAGMASMDFVSAAKIGDFFVSLDQGVLPYAPVALTLAFVALGQALRRRDWWSLTRFAIVVAAVIVTATTIEWNSDAAGLRRHAMWILPLIIWIAVDFAGTNPRVTRSTAALVLAQLLVTSVWIFPPGMIQHSNVCEYALGHLSWFHPLPEVFAPRTVHLAEPLAQEVPVCFASPSEVTRVLTDSRHLKRLNDYLALRVGAERAIAAAEPAGDGLLYVDFDEGQARLLTQDSPLEPGGALLVSRVGGPSPFGHQFDRFNRYALTRDGAVSVGLYSSYATYAVARNTSGRAWHPQGSHPISMVTEVRDHAGRVVTSSAPIPLARTVLPYESADLYGWLLSPTEPGRYRVVVILRQAWPDGTVVTLCESDPQQEIEASVVPVAPRTSR